MAILPIFPGYSARILINGELATEYEDPDDFDPKHPNPAVNAYQTAVTSSVYIESETDAEFSIELRVTPPLIDASKTKDKMKYTKLKAYIEVDGHKAWVSECGRAWFNDREDQEVRTEWQDEVLGLKEGKGRGCTLRRFKFAKIDTNTEETSISKITRIAQRLKKVGLIEIKVYSETYGKKGGPTEADSSKFLKGPANVHEKALKGDAKSHGTSLAEKENVARGLVSRTDKKDGEDYPVAVFRFMYRSRESLRQLLIVPRTPSPAPSRSPSRSRSPSMEIQGDTYGIPGLAQLVSREVEKRIRNMLAGNTNGRGLGSGMSRNALKKIKREHDEERGRGRDRYRGHASKKSKGSRGEPVVIEISDSEDDDSEEEGLFVT